MFDEEDRERVEGDVAKGTFAQLVGDVDHGL
jgi:hypothetical protein